MGGVWADLWKGGSLNVLRGQSIHHRHTTRLPYLPPAGEVYIGEWFGGQRHGCGARIDMAPFYYLVERGEDPAAAYRRTYDRRGAAAWVVFLGGCGLWRKYPHR